MTAEKQIHPRRSRNILFYTRETCLLCDEFEALLQASLQDRGFRYERIDIDRNPGAKDRYGRRIPVLEIDGEVVAEGRVTPLAWNGKSRPSWGKHPDGEIIQLSSPGKSIKMKPCCPREKRDKG